MRHVTPLAILLQEQLFFFCRECDQPGYQPFLLSNTSGLEFFIKSVNTTGELMQVISGNSLLPEPFDMNFVEHLLSSLFVSSAMHLARSMDNAGLICALIVYAATVTT